MHAQSKEPLLTKQDLILNQINNPLLKDMLFQFGRASSEQPEYQAALSRIGVILQGTTDPKTQNLVQQFFVADAILKLGDTSQGLFQVLQQQEGTSPEAQLLQQQLARQQSVHQQLQTQLQQLEQQGQQFIPA